MSSNTELQKRIRKTLLETQYSWDREGQPGNLSEKQAAAVLPIIAAEVQAAKAEVWVEAIRYSIECGNETTDSWGNMYRLDWIDRMEHEIEENPYTETGDRA